MKHRLLIILAILVLILIPVVKTAADGVSRSGLKTLVTVSPTYPISSLRANREGSTIVCFYVDAGGVVIDPMVLSSTHPDFEEAALDAARRTVYAAHKQTNSDDTYTCLRYRFRL